MAYAYKKRRAFYAGWVDESGLPRREPVPAKTLSEAKKLASEMELRAWRVRNGLEEASCPRLTVNDGIALRLDAFPPEYASKRRQKELLAHIAKEMGGRQIHEIRPLHVLRLLGNLTFLKPQTREHVRMAGQGLFSFLAKKAKVFKGDNPFKEAGRVDVPEREPNFFSPEQFDRLVKVMKPHLAAAALFSALTGTRKAEVRKALKINTFVNERYVLLRSPKNRKDRRVPIPDVLVPLLMRQMNTPGPFLFARPDGTQYTNNWRVHDVIARACVRAGLVQGVKPYCFRKACGWKGDMVSEKTSMTCPRCGRAARWRSIPLPLRFKELRSTYATLGYATTGDLHFVQKVLGHSDPKLTQARYARALPERLLQGANAVGSVLAGTVQAVSPGREKAKEE